MDTAVDDPFIGQVLEGRYHVRSRVARGGMATVYVAHDERLGRTVALKVMHANLAADEEFVRRFIGEATSAAALSSPNVVGVYDQGTDQGHVFLVMEYVPGRTLRELLGERGRLGPREALEMMRPVLGALGAAHRAGLVHRDVKPENVLLTDDGQVKVADFGLARAENATGQTKTGMIIGTVGYLAPEQVVSGTSNARSDVYAAGIMLFELLTGYQPYSGETPLAVAYKHVNDVVPLPSSVVEGLPPQLDTLVATATGHDPARRPVDADAFLAIVDGVLRALPSDVDARLASVVAVPPHPQGQAGTSRPNTMVVPAGERPDALPEQRRPLGERLLGVATGRYALIAVGLVAVMLVGWLIWAQTVGRHVHVPKVAGMTQAAAVSKIQSLDLKTELGKPRYDKSIPKGKVAQVEPAPGTELDKGETVTVVLSKGKPPVEIPDVSGMPLDQAKQALQKVGLTPGDVEKKYNTDVDRGKVIKTDPRAGHDQLPDKPVKLLVSGGVKVPDVRKMKRDEAEQALRDLGLDPVFQEQDAKGKPPNTVIGQNPAPGTAVDRGSDVQVVVTKKNTCQWWNPFCDHGGGKHGMGDVPNVVDHPVAVAEQELKAAGFKVKVRGHGGPLVQGQNPNGGKARRGSTVVIWH